MASVNKLFAAWLSTAAKARLSSHGNPKGVLSSVVTVIRSIIEALCGAEEYADLVDVLREERRVDDRELNADAVEVVLGGVGLEVALSLLRGEAMVSEGS